jgi:CelD/BcsL family acetyltransferase involved in cellulose biosynthesis
MAPNKPSAREIHASDSRAYLTGPINRGNPTNSMNPTNPVRLATDNDQPGWDSYVLSNPDAGPYHLYGWKTAVEKAYGHKGYYLMAEDAIDGSCVGVLPLICFKKMPWGRKSLISLPYCDYAGPLGGPSVKKALLDKCHDLAQDIGASTIELRCPNKVSFEEASTALSDPIIK